MPGGCAALLETVERVAGERLPRRRGVYVVVFGSVAEGRCGPLSDVDIAVKGLSLDEASELAGALEFATGRRVDVVLLEHAGLPLRYEALGRGILVAGDRGAFILDRWLAIIEWLDFREAYEYMHNAYLKRTLRQA